jgi:hypothetical protein
MNSKGALAVKQLLAESASGLSCSGLPDTVGAEAKLAIADSIGEQVAALY